MGTSESEERHSLPPDEEEARRQEDAEKILQRADLKPESREDIPGEDKKDLLDPTIARGSGGALAWMLGRTPCLDLFLFMAERTRPGATRTARAIELREAHPWWYAASFFMDSLLRVATALALLVLVLAVAWKTLAPIPPLPSLPVGAK